MRRARGLGRGPGHGTPARIMDAGALTDRDVALRTRRQVSTPATPRSICTRRRSTMGRRGPPPKPSRLKKLQGTYRPDRAAPAEMAPKIGKPTCPRHLKGEARAEWRRVVRALEPLRVLSPIDGSRLADYCLAHALAIRAAGLAEEQGEVIAGERGPVKNPWHVIAQEARAQARLLGAEFGLTPSSRSRVSAAPAEPESDPLLEFMMGHGPRPGSSEVKA